MLASMKVYFRRTDGAHSCLFKRKFYCKIPFWYFKAATYENILQLLKLMFPTESGPYLHSCSENSTAACANNPSCPSLISYKDTGC